MDRVWFARARWKLRGAWLWPAFLVLTLVDGVVIARLPPWGEGPGSLVGATLAAGFANLAGVAVLGTLLGRGLRRRRRDLPRGVADDYAGTSVLVVVALAFLALGVLHRPARADLRADAAAAAAAASAYAARAGTPAGPVGRPDVVRLAPEAYRACVATAETIRSRRWLCVFVDTRQRPPGVTRDEDRSANDRLRAPGGLR